MESSTKLAITNALAISCQDPLTKESVLTEHADVFKGLGKFPGSSVHLHLKKGYKAASRGICKVPVHMEKNLQKKSRT